MIGMCLIAVGLMQAETLSVSASEIGAGEQASLTIELENKTMMPTAWQMALSLPEGVTIAEREGGGYECELSSRHDASHSLTVVRQGDSRYVLICYSAKNTAISGQGGSLVSIKVQASVEAKGKKLKGAVANAVLSDANGVKAHLAEAEFQLEVVYPIIHIASASRKYGDANPSFTYTVTGATLRGTPQLKTSASASSPVGKYSISAERGSVQNAYYEVEDGALTVAKAALTISAGTYTKKQGEAMPEFTLTYDGFKNSETKTVLTKQAAVSCEATVGSAPGQYPVIVSGATAQNYDISYTNGVLIVTDADPVIIRAKSYVRKYGDSNPTFEYEIEGAALDGQPEIYCSATPASSVGTYDIVVKMGTVKNYNVQLVNGTLTVNPALLTVKAVDATMEAGNEVPSLSVEYSGWKNGEDESVLTAKPVASTTATKESVVGTYPIMVSGGEALNYSFTYVEGVLTITEPSSVKEILVSGKPFNIYNTMGMLVRYQATTLSDLPTGIYIVNGQKIVVK